MEDDQLQSEPCCKIQRLSTMTDVGDSVMSGLASVVSWPQLAFAVQDGLLAATGVKSQLTQNLSSDTCAWWVTTSYSGLGTFEHCLSRISALNHEHAFDEKVFPPFKFWSATDADPDSRVAIMKSKICPLHVFGDIEERVPTDVLDRLNFVVKTLKGPLASLDKREMTPADKKKAKAEINERCMSKLLAVAWEAFSEDRGQTSAYCYKHGCKCPLLPPMSPGDILLEAGGNTCVSFSPQGSQAKWVHESGVTAAIWFGWCRRYADALFQECSHLFNTSAVLKAAFPEEQWKTSVLQLSAKDVGVPMVRPRNWSWTVRTNKLKLSSDLSSDLFLKCCGSDVKLTGHDFCVMSDSEAAGYLTELGQCLHPHETSGRQFLTAGCLRRLDEYEAFRQRMIGEGKDVPVPLVDLSQNVMVREKLSEFCPSLLCHSVIWSCQRNRKLLLPELFLLMGWPVPLSSSALAEGHAMEDDGAEFPWEAADFFQGFSDRSLTKLIGNSFHCRVVGLFLLMCLSLTEVKGEQKC